MTGAWIARAASLKKSNLKAMPDCSLSRPFTICHGGSINKAMGQIKVDSIEDLKIGMQVHPSWEPVRVQAGEDVYGLKFEPIK